MQDKISENTLDLLLYIHDFRKRNDKNCSVDELVDEDNNVDSIKSDLFLLEKHGMISVDEQKKFILISDKGIEISKKEYTKRSQQMWNDTFEKAYESKAYKGFCQRVYGIPLYQFNMTPISQLKKVLSLMELKSDSSILDAGCGLGAISKYISSEINAKVDGFDFSERAIEIAKIEAKNYNDIQYFVADFNSLDLPCEKYDAIIAIDSLYFCTNLSRTIAVLYKSLKVGGRLGVLWTSSSDIINSYNSDVLDPEKTPIATSFFENNIKFTAIDLSSDQKSHWSNCIKFIPEYLDEFKKEECLDLYEGKKREIEKMNHLANKDFLRRYLYLVRKI